MKSEERLHERLAEIPDRTWEDWWLLLFGPSHVQFFQALHRIRRSLAVLVHLIVGRVVFGSIALLRLESVLPFSHSRDSRGGGTYLFPNRRPTPQALIRILLWLRLVAFDHSPVQLSLIHVVDRLPSVFWQREFHVAKASVRVGGGLSVIFVSTFGENKP